MNQEILNKAEELINYTNGNICNHCLGRKFSDCVEGNGNEDRGIKIRESLNLEAYDGECEICHNIHTANKGIPQLRRSIRVPSPSLQEQRDLTVVGRNEHTAHLKGQPRHTLKGS